MTIAMELGRSRAWRTLLLLLALVLAWGLGVAGSAAAAPAIPPAPRARVTDEVGVLSAPVRESLDQRLAAYEARSGHQVIVWIAATSAGIPIEEFASEAFEQWKIGRADLDDGLGVFVLVDDRVVRVEVGYGLEPTITDLEASQVIRAVMIPLIRAGEWDAAIERGVEALVDTIEGQPGSLPAAPHPAGGPEADQGMTKTQIIATIIGIALFMVLLITNPRLALLLLFFLGRGGGGGGGGGDFRGRGGSSGGGGATGRW